MTLPRALALCYLAGAVAIAAVDVLPSVAHCLALCELGRDAARARDQPASAMAGAAPLLGEVSFAVPRKGERVLRCWSLHCLRPGDGSSPPLACHDDLACYCAPATMPPAQAALLVGGADPGAAHCEDRPAPPCPPRHCLRHLEW
jgi:hypothetical protein